MVRINKKRTEWLRKKPSTFLDVIAHPTMKIWIRPRPIGGWIFSQSGIATIQAHASPGSPQSFLGTFKCTNSGPVFGPGPPQPQVPWGVRYTTDLPPLPCFPARPLTSAPSPAALTSLPPPFTPSPHLCPDPSPLTFPHAPCSTIVCFILLYSCLSVKCMDRIQWRFSFGNFQRLIHMTT